MRITDWSSDVCSSDRSSSASSSFLPQFSQFLHPPYRSLLHQFSQFLHPPYHSLLHQFSQFLHPPYHSLLHQFSQFLHPPYHSLLHQFSQFLHQRLHQFSRSEEHTSELQSLMRISYAVFCLQKKNIILKTKTNTHNRLKLNQT